MDESLALAVQERMHAALDNDRTLARAVRAELDWPSTPPTASEVCRFLAATGIDPLLLLAPVEHDARALIEA